MKYLIGLDGGLAQTKAVLFDLNGVEINKIMVENEIIADGDRCEMDMNDFWEKAAAAVKLLMTQSNAEPDEVVGIGVTGQGEGLWPVSEEGKPVCNAILGIDHRARNEAFLVRNQTPGLGKLVHRNIGCPVGNGSPLMILRWLKKNRLDLYQKTSVVLLAKDWLRYCMTGRVVTDFSDGVSSFLRFPSGRIPSQMMMVLELPDAVEKLPGVLASTSIAGTLTEEAAEKMGLNPGTPVSTGAMDSVAADLGVGAVNSGDASVILGSTNASMIVHDRENCDPTRHWQYFVCHAVEDKAVEILSTMDITANLEWALEELTGGLDYSLAERLIESAEPGSSGVFFLPYLSASRERVSSVSTSATASFFGMTEETTKRQMLRSVYEAVAYSIRDAFSNYKDVDKIVISGCTSMKGVLPRIIADITHSVVGVSKGTEFAAKGAAMTAGIGVGAFQDIGDAVKHCCKLEKIYQAKPKPVYEDGYQVFRELCRAFGPMWEARQKFVDKYPVR